MLQFIAETNGTYSIAEQMQMVIEGGCAWIQLRLPDVSDEGIRELAGEIIPLCKETATILTLENRIELAKDLGIHGVHITETDLDPATVRQLLGPEAIIGVQVSSAASVITLQDKDIDYATFDPVMTIYDIKKAVNEIRDAGVGIPLVATGDIPVEKVKETIDAGVNGIATGRIIAQAEDPVGYTSMIIDTLKKV